MAQGRIRIGYFDETTGDPREPNPRQAMAHRCTADELLYGGSAGGGKTEYFVVDGLQFCLKYPRVQVAMFRRHYKQLEQSVIPRILAHTAVLRELGLAKWQDSKGRVQFVNGSLLWLLYCDRDADVYNYQSAQWHRLYLDEASHLTEFMAVYLGSRVRSNIRGILPRRRYASNPGNVGHAWLLERFVEPPPMAWRTLGHPPGPNEVWIPELTPDQEAAIAALPAEVAAKLPTRLSRAFIPARLYDNTALMESDPSYVWNLMQMPEDERRMLLEGDWSVWAGQVFREFHKTHLVTPGDPLMEYGYGMGQVVPWHVIPISGWLPPKGTRVFGSVDYGYANPWAFYLHATLADGHLVTFRETYKAGLRDDQQADYIGQMIERDCVVGKRYPAPEFIVCGTDLWQSRREHNRAETFADVYEAVLRPMGVRLQPAATSAGSRVAGVQRIKEALAAAPDGFPWWQITEDCPVLIKQLPMLPRDPNNPEDVDTDAEDHAYDSVRYYLQARPAFPAKPAPDVYAHLDPISRAEWERLEAREKPAPAGFAGNFTPP